MNCDAKLESNRSPYESASHAVEKRNNNRVSVTSIRQRNVFFSEAEKAVKATERFKYKHRPKWPKTRQLSLGDVNAARRGLIRVSPTSRNGERNVAWEQYICNQGIKIRGNGHIRFFITPDSPWDPSLARSVK